MKAKTLVITKDGEIANVEKVKRVILRVLNLSDAEQKIFLRSIVTILAEIEK